MSNSNNSKQETNKKNTFRTVLNLIFAGVGLGVIFGSILKTISLNEKNSIFLNPSFFSLENSSSKINQKITNPLGKVLKGKIIGNNTKNNRSLRELNQIWRDIEASQKGLQASAFLLSINDGSQAQLNPDLVLPAASSIKAPILLVALRLFDKGELLWNENLTLTEDVIGGEAGWMGYQPLGKSFPIYEIATEMIRISDNTATNLLIKRIGGKEILNQHFKELGLRSTRVNNWLPDLNGTNKTSARDLAITFKIVESDKYISSLSRDLFKEIMRTSSTNSLLPEGLLRGLGTTNTRNADYSLMIKGYSVYNKTGDIGIAYSDAGLIQMPDASRAVASFIVVGPFNDPRSPELIREMAAAMAKKLSPGFPPKNFF